MDVLYEFLRAQKLLSFQNQRIIGKAQWRRTKHQRWKKGLLRKKKK